MIDTSVLDGVRNLISQLPAAQQLQLAAQIYEQPSHAEIANLTPPADDDDWLARCDAIATQVGGEFDSAADLRTIRDEHPAASYPLT